MSRCVVLIASWALIVLLISSSVQAAVFFGEDLNATATGGNEDAVRIAHPNADAARSAFLSQLIGVGTETFESFAGGASVSTLTFGSDTATLSPALSALDVPTGTFNGVYPISGDKTLLQAVGASNSFTVTFSDPQVAFGFYITDLEVPGNLRLRFHRSDVMGSFDVDVPSTAGTGGVNNTGSVVYVGVLEPAQPFESVEFIRTLNSDDGFGFDDLTIGSIENVAIPEPATAALLGFAAMAVGLRRGKR